MTLIQLYSKFCNFIDEQIFSEDYVGMSVSFVVDKALITEFCKKNCVTENTLMDAVRVNLYSYSKDIKHVTCKRYTCYSALCSFKKSKQWWRNSKKL